MNILHVEDVLKTVQCQVMVDTRGMEGGRRERERERGREGRRWEREGEREGGGGRKRQVR